MILTEAVLLYIKKKKHTMFKSNKKDKQTKTTEGNKEGRKEGRKRKLEEKAK